MNLLGIDFEDWYHPQLVEPFVAKDKKIPTMHKGLDKILELLRKNNTTATFFMVGEILQENPEILDRIISEKHEIAFHTMTHTRLDDENFQLKFNDELKQFDKLTSKKSKGFRAPTFSLNKESSWYLDFLEKNGYLYDSSIVPAKTSMYGFPNAEISPYKISKKSLEKNDNDGKIIEFPILISKIANRKIPIGGGFYLRFFLLNKIKKSIRDYEKKNIPSTFYIHSWELTPEYFPKISLPLKNKFVTFYNIKNTYSKLDSILKEFNFGTFQNYLKNIK